MNSEPKIYIARAGRNGEDEEVALDNDMAIIGFREVPDLANAGDHQAMVKLVKHALPDQRTPCPNQLRWPVVYFLHMRCRKATS